MKVKHEKLVKTFWANCLEIVQCYFTCFRATTTSVILFGCISLVLSYPKSEVIAYWGPKSYSICPYQV
jgi:hypothetical protein